MRPCGIFASDGIRPLGSERALLSWGLRRRRSCFHRRQRRPHQHHLRRRHHYDIRSLPRYGFSRSSAMPRVWADIRLHCARNGRRAAVRERRHLGHTAEVAARRSASARSTDVAHWMTPARRRASPPRGPPTPFCGPWRRRRRLDAREGCTCAVPVPALSDPCLTRRWRIRSPSSCQWRLSEAALTGRSPNLSEGLLGLRLAG